MSQLIINTNKGTADSLKTGATKINSNFTELYSILANNPISIPALLGNSGKYLTTDGNSVIWQTFQVPDAVVTTGSYANPSWITSLNYSKLTNTPNLAIYLTTGSLSVSTITPSGTGALSYSNGVFTYTPPNLATVATSGSYADLTNKPTITAIPTQTANSGKYLTTDGTTLSWATVTGGTNDYNSLINKPTIPAAQVNSDWNAISGLAQILNKPALFSGSYTDLTNKPTIPAAQVQTDWNAVSGLGVVLNKPTIPAAQVQTDWNAVSGLGVILNKPTISDAYPSFSPKITLQVTIVSPQAPDTGNKYFINGEYKPQLKLQYGYTYVFDQSDNTNVYWPNANGTTPNPHNLNFSSDNLSGEVGGGTAFLTNVVYKLNGVVVTRTVYNGADFITATQRSVEITVANNFPTTLYYWCYNHLNMGSSISFVNPRLSSLADVLISGATTGQVLKYNGTAWINDADAVSGGAGVGTVTTVSFTSANGFTGTVATASSTPAITLTTSITGVLKGNGTAILAATSGTDYAPGTGSLITGIVKSTTTTGALSIAVAGTDYQAPIGTISGMVKGNGANALTAATAGTDYQAPLPAQSGQTGKYLTTDGTTLSWGTVSGAGTVTSVSVASANGFAGTVANSTSTPAITITTSITGLLKGNATAISAAVSGTDYQAPIGTISGLVKGNGANALTAAVAGTDYQSAQSVNGIVKSSGTTRSAAVAGTDYIAPYSSQAANTHLAAPSGAAGAPTFRLLTSADIPSTLGTTAHSGTVTLNASANLIFTGSSSGTITFVAGVSPANQSYTLPSAFPSVTGHVLSSTTGGALSWVGAASGTVTSVSVASANGFTGTVANSTSTPAITITTSITGVLKGNGTSISAAVSGTDYQAPIGTISGIVKGNGANALTAAVAGTDYQAPIGTITGLVKGNGANALTAAQANIDYQSAQSVTGIVKSLGTTRSAAVAGTDYQAPISLTTIGSSGAATFNGTTLNIPQYSGGGGSFSALSDAASASLTVDKIYLPAITRLNVTTPVFNYNIDQYSGDNPGIYVISGTTIAFNLQVGGSHPFLIQTNTGSWANITTANLIHVSTSGVVSTGSSAQGQTSGTLYWKIPASVSGTFRYICQNHASMVGTITVKDIAAI